MIQCKYTELKTSHFMLCHIFFKIRYEFSIKKLLLINNIMVDSCLKFTFKMLKNNETLIENRRVPESQRKTSYFMFEIVLVLKCQ